MRTDWNLLIPLILLLLVIPATISDAEQDGAPMLHSILINDQELGKAYLHPGEELHIMVLASYADTINATLQEKSGGALMTIELERQGSGRPATFEGSLELPEDINPSLEHKVEIIASNQNATSRETAGRTIIPLHLFLEATANPRLSDHSIDVQLTARAVLASSEDGKSSIDGTLSVTLFRYLDQENYTTTTLGQYSIQDSTAGFSYHVQEDTTALYKFIIDASETTTGYLGRTEVFAIGVPERVDMNTSRQMDTIQGFKLHGPYLPNEVINLTIAPMDHNTSWCGTLSFHTDLGSYLDQDPALQIDIQPQNSIPAPSEPGLYFAIAVLNLSGNQTIGICGILVSEFSINLATTPQNIDAGDTVFLEAEFSKPYPALSKARLTISNLDAGEIPGMLIDGPALTNGKMKIGYAVPAFTPGGEYYAVLEVEADDGSIGCTVASLSVNSSSITPVGPNGGHEDEDDDEVGDDGLPQSFILLAIAIITVAVISFLFLLRKR